MTWNVSINMKWNDSIKMTWNDTINTAWNGSINTPVRLNNLDYWELLSIVLIPLKPQYSGSDGLE